MTAIDEIYLNSYKEYKEFQEWLLKQPKLKDKYGTEVSIYVYFSDWLDDPKDWENNNSHIVFFAPCYEYNKNQREFRFGLLDVSSLHNRIAADAKSIKYELEVTHCDEMDRVTEFSKEFDKINTYDSPLII